MFEFNIRFGKSKAAEQRSVEVGQKSDLASPADWLVAALGGMPSGSGVNVSQDSALTFSAVYSCIDIISRTLAMLPFKLYEKNGNTVRAAEDHPYFDMLINRANHVMNAYKMKETLQMHVCSRGNGFLQKIYDTRGNVAELRLLTPGTVSADVVNNRLWYVVSGEPSAIAYEDIIHISGINKKGYWGLSPIAVARESIGEGLAAQKYNANLMKNGGSMSGVVEMPGQMSDDAYRRFKENFNANYHGVNNIGKTAILEQGGKYNRIGVSPADAQYIESRKFSIEEIGRIYSVPLFMLARMDNFTIGNMEQIALYFIQNTMMRWFTQWENEFNDKMLSPAERKKYYWKFNVNALLRADAKTRAEFYRVMFNIASMSPDEIRGLEEMNPYADEQGSGSKLYQPMNMCPLGTDTTKIKQQGGTNPNPDTNNIQ